MSIKKWKPIIKNFEKHLKQYHTNPTKAFLDWYTHIVMGGGNCYN